MVDVGKRIKSIRKRKGLTLQELSGKSGMSATAISAIERNVSSPTVNTLVNIGKALGESISSLLGESEVRYIVTRAADREQIAGDVRNADFRSLGSGIPGQPYRPMLCTLKPGSSSGDDFVNHPGDDFIHVLQGVLEVEMNGNVLRLAEGDSLYCRGNTPYRWKNGADGETRFLFVASG
jgi:XRE family transcriptional regulator, regulator of sulfur utilization